MKQPKLTWGYDSDSGEFCVYVDGKHFDEWILLDQDPEEAFAWFAWVFNAGVQWQRDNE